MEEWKLNNLIDDIEAGQRARGGKRGGLGGGYDLKGSGVRKAREKNAAEAAAAGGGLFLGMFVPAGQGNYNNQFADSDDDSDDVTNDKKTRFDDDSDESESSGEQKKRKKGKKRKKTESQVEEPPKKAAKKKKSATKQSDDVNETALNGDDDALRGFNLKSAIKTALKEAAKDGKSTVKVKKLAKAIHKQYVVHCGDKKALGKEEFQELMLTKARKKFNVSADNKTISKSD